MAETVPTAHRRQFLIARAAHPGWTAHPLPDGYVLSFDPALPSEEGPSNPGYRTELQPAVATIEWPICGRRGSVAGHLLNETGISQAIADGRIHYPD